MPEGAFNGGFDPITRPGGFVQFDSATTGPVYAVTGYNVLPGITLESDFSVNDGSLEKRELTDIEMDDGYLSQYRLLRLPEELPDDVEIRVDHDGKQSPLYQTKNRRGALDNQTGAIYTDDGANSSIVDAHDSRFTELFVWEDNPPYFTVENNSGGQVTFNLTFSGYAYELEQVAEGPSNFDGPQPVVIPRRSLQR